MGSQAGGNEVGGSGDSATEEPSRGQGLPRLLARSAGWSQGLTNQGVVPILKALGLSESKRNPERGPGPHGVFSLEEAWRSSSQTSGLIHIPWDAWENADFPVLPRKSGAQELLPGIRIFHIFLRFFSEVLQCWPGLWRP